MEITISQTVQMLKSKPLTVNNMPVSIKQGIDPEIRFYNVEDCGDTEELS